MEFRRSGETKLAIMVLVVLPQIQGLRVVFGSAAKKKPGPHSKELTFCFVNAFSFGVKRWSPRVRKETEVMIFRTKPQAPY